MSVQAAGVPVFSRLDIAPVGFDFTPFLGKFSVNETLTGTVTLTPSTGLLVTSPAINTIVITINGVAVAIGKAFQCYVYSASAGVYTLTATALTTGGQTRTVVGSVRFE